MGGFVSTGEEVEKIVIGNHRLHGIIIDGKLHTFDKVISTVPIVQFLRLIDPEALEKEFPYRNRIQYQGVICILLVLKKRLSHYYWIPVVDSGASFSGIVETTNLIRQEDIGGINLVYLLSYVPNESLLFSAKDQELISRSIDELKELFSGFDQSQVLESHVFKAPFVEPVWTLYYSLQMPPRALLDNTLILLTTSHLYPGINSTGNCVKQVMEQLDKHLK
jgi:protoporphyrinogen oxidase